MTYFEISRFSGLTNFDETAVQSTIAQQDSDLSSCNDMKEDEAAKQQDKYGPRGEICQNPKKPLRLKLHLLLNGNKVC